MCRSVTHDEMYFNLKHFQLSDMLIFDVTYLQHLFACFLQIAKIYSYRIVIKHANLRYSVH